MPAPPVALRLGWALGFSLLALLVRLRLGERLPDMGNPPSLIHRLKNGPWVKRMLFTRDSRWLIRGGSDGLELVELAGPKRIELDSRGAVEDLALDERGALIVAGDRDGRLTAWAVPG